LLKVALNTTTTPCTAKFWKM